MAPDEPPVDLVPANHNLIRTPKQFTSSNCKHKYNSNNQEGKQAYSRTH